MTRESWVGKKVEVYFEMQPMIVGVVRRESQATGDTWHIVAPATDFTPEQHYLVQGFTFMKEITDQ